ncbi:hypothetical protein [Humidesulfovibrio idahonensis]
MTARQDGEAGGSGGGEQGRGTDDAPYPDGVLIAENGRVVTDAGAGPTCGAEPRRPLVHPPRCWYMLA